MLALIAAICFAISLILHLIGGHAGLVLDFELGGLLAVALHMAFAVGLPWHRQ